VESPPGYYASGLFAHTHHHPHSSRAAAAARRRRRGGGTRRRSIRMPYNIRSCTTNSCVWGPWVAYLANLIWCILVPESLAKSQCGQLAWQLLNTCSLVHVQRPRMCACGRMRRRPPCPRAQLRVARGPGCLPTNGSRCADCGPRVSRGATGLAAPRLKDLGRRRLPAALGQWQIAKKTSQTIKNRF
jgi:hypothetical protein